MSLYWIIVIFSFFAFFWIVPIVLKILKLLGIYDIVEEQRCHVYTLFGNVEAIVNEPGLVFLWGKMGIKALFINWIGKCYKVDMRLDQSYMRSLPVNSEEGAPMGIGVWYEMFVSDPVAYLFKNIDPRGSLQTNVSNSTVRCLSNMKLADMLQTRHAMSETVRNEVTPKSHEWGYKLGSVYIRKVHFRDYGMIRQIEEKVVNRLRQVTSAIKQEGNNQVRLITSAAEREAAQDFAKAEALRPQIIGHVLQEIARDPEVSRTLFEVLEIQNLLTSNAKITLVPDRCALLPELLAAGGGEKSANVIPSSAQAAKAH